MRMSSAPAKKSSGDARCASQDPSIDRSTTKKSRFKTVTKFTMAFSERKNKVIIKRFLKTGFAPDYFQNSLNVLY